MSPGATKRSAATTGSSPAATTPAPLLEVRAHENGAVESHHGHLETALDQALILRGGRDFATIDVRGRGDPAPRGDDYRRFVDQLVGRRNRRREDRIVPEMAALRPLPARRTTDFTTVRGCGDPAPHKRACRPGHPHRRIPRSPGLLQRTGPVDRPPLPNWRLRVHLYDDRIEAWLGATHVLNHPRKRGRKDGRRLHVIDYRPVRGRGDPAPRGIVRGRRDPAPRGSVIHALRRKPQALAGSIYRDELFPGTAYAPRTRAGAWRRLSLALPQKDACRRMVALLALAHDEACETKLGKLIDQDLAAGRLPDARQLRDRLQRHEPELPVPAGSWGPRSPTRHVPVVLTALASFDSLLAARP